MRTQVTAWMAGLGMVLGGAMATAADPPATLDDALAAARGAFAPLDERRLPKAQQKLAAALDNLDRFISRAGPAISKQWKDYLHFDELKAQLAAGATPDPKLILAALEKFESGVVGMEVPAFRDTRLALQDYYHLLVLSREEKLGELYTTELDALAKSVATYKDKASADDAHRIGRIASWLDRLGRGESVASAVRRTYMFPNLNARISAKLIAAGIDEPVEDHSFVRDNILGTSIHANAHTSGHLSSELIPDPHRATIDLRMVGTTFASSVGYNGPATIRSSSTTNLEGRKRVMFDADGIQAQNATAGAATGSTIHSISAKCGFIEKIAWKRAGKQKGQVEHIASQHAAARLAGRMNQQAMNSLADASDKFQQKFRLPLLRRDAFPQTLAFQTTAEAIQVTGLAATASQIAAHTTPPAIEGSHDLSVQAHQSIVNNLAESILGHETLTDVRLAKLMEDLTGEVPEELKITEDKDPWSITFAADQPITLEVEDQGLKISIRASRFTRSDNKVNKPMVISASYKVEKTPEGSKLVRQGNVDAEFVRVGPLGPADLGFKTFIGRKFSALFKPEIESKGIKLSGRLAKVGTLRLAQLYADNGWLALAWDSEAASAE